MLVGGAPLYFMKGTDRDILPCLAVSRDVRTTGLCPFFYGVLFQVWEGYNVVKTSRAMVGETNPVEAKAGTVRGDFSVHVSRYEWDEIAGNTGSCSAQS